MLLDILPKFHEIFNELFSKNFHAWAKDYSNTDVSIAIPYVHSHYKIPVKDDIVSKKLAKN